MLESVKEQQVDGRGCLKVKSVKVQQEHLDGRGGLKVEKEAYRMTLNSKDRLEGLKAFSQKRAPRWSGK